VNKGIYILLLHLPAGLEIRVGKLGDFYFKKGWYAYVGSAMNNLDARITRHLKREKKLHWHIDYLRREATVAGVHKFESGVPGECELSRKVAALADATPARKFGASDCHCISHLHYFEEKPEFLGL
jgi:Uri superfamily endonuclease